MQLIAATLLAVAALAAAAPLKELLTVQSTPLAPGLTLDWKNDGQLHFTVTYAGLGWVAFGVSATGDMVPASAPTSNCVVCIPGNTSGTAQYAVWGIP